MLKNDREEKKMPETVSNVISKFSLQMKKLFGETLSKIIVYGSYARGDYKRCL